MHNGLFLTVSPCLCLSRSLSLSLFLRLSLSLSPSLSLIFLSFSYEARKKQQELFNVQYEAWLAVYSILCMDFACEQTATRGSPVGYVHVQLQISKRHRLDDVMNLKSSEA